MNRTRRTNHGYRPLVWGRRELACVTTPSVRVKPLLPENHKDEEKGLIVRDRSYKVRKSLGEFGLIPPAPRPQGSCCSVRCTSSPARLHTTGANISPSSPSSCECCVSAVAELGVRTRNFRATVQHSRKFTGAIAIVSMLFYVHAGSVLCTRALVVVILVACSGPWDRASSGRTASTSTMTTTYITVCHTRPPPPTKNSLNNVLGIASSGRGGIRVHASTGRIGGGGPSVRAGSRRRHRRGLAGCRALQAPGTRRRCGRPLRKRRLLPSESLTRTTSHRVVSLCTFRLARTPNRLQS